MPIYCEQLENILLKWLAFFLVKKPTNSAASSYTYNVFQKLTKERFMKEVGELFDSLTQKDIEIVEKEGIKNIFLGQ